MAAFLWWIGLYNLFGSLVLAAMHQRAFADFMLRRATEVIAEPYEHGAFGRLWLWWAAATNAFLGAIMIRAATWPAPQQRDVAVGAIGVYAIMYVVVIVGARRPKYSPRGVAALHVLWLAQIGWGVWSVWTG
jgi:hypothetical protein